MKTIITTLAVLVALAGAATASAHAKAGYWTAEHAEESLLDSPWMERQGYDEVSCSPRGTAKKDATGAKTWRHFWCEFTDDFDPEYGRGSQLHVLAGDRYLLFPVDRENGSLSGPIRGGATLAAP
jgi:hypothetical protein